jgi:hypothetical protein
MKNSCGFTRDEHVRGFQVHSDVAAGTGLRRRALPQLVRVVEGLPEHQSAPTEILHNLFRCVVVFGGLPQGHAVPTPST